MTSETIESKIYTDKNKPPIYMLSKQQKKDGTRMLIVGLPLILASVYAGFADLSPERFPVVGVLVASGVLYFATKSRS